MLTAQVVGTVHAVKVTEKALMLSVTSKKFNKVQRIGVTIFLRSNSTIQNVIKKGSVIAVSGNLDMSEYNGKTSVRILAAPSDIHFVERGNSNGYSGGNGTYKKKSAPKAAPSEDDDIYSTGPTDGMDAPLEEDDDILA